MFVKLDTNLISKHQVIAAEVFMQCLQRDRRNDSPLPKKDETCVGLMIILHHIRLKSCASLSHKTS